MGSTPRRGDRPVRRRIAAVLVLVAAILGLPVVTPTATTMLAVAHAACPPDCGTGGGSNGGPPGGGTEFVPPQMPQPPNINGGYNYPAPDQANGISIYNQSPSAQGPAPSNATSPQTGQSWQSAANGEQQPIQYQSAPRAEQVSKQFADLQTQLSQPPSGTIIWCTPSTMGTGFICEYMGADGGITWRHSPLDVTGGMP
ncbi:hypothetical protein QN239_31070 [Mycolicibacterium sp. Y3]